MEVFQPINEKEMIEHHHFATPSELMDLGIEHLTAASIAKQKTCRRYIPPDENHTTNHHL